MVAELEGRKRAETMRRKTRRRVRRRAAPPFAILSLAVVLAAFVFAAGRQAEAPQDQATFSAVSAGQEGKPPPSPTPSSTESTTSYIPDEAEVEMLARLIWGEARGVPSDMEKAAVVWCVLNRVDAEEWPDSVAEVIGQRGQFSGYSPDYPATQKHKEIAADVLARWEREKEEGSDVGRVLPPEFVFFTGDGERNTFRTEYKGGVYWDWSLENPYSS